MGQKMDRRLVGFGKLSLPDNLCVDPDDHHWLRSFSPTEDSAMERPRRKDCEDRVDQVALGLVEDDAEHVNDDVLDALLQPYSMRLIGAGDLDRATGSS